MPSLLVAALLLLLAPAPVRAEIRRVDGVLAASSKYVIYSEGRVVPPGRVDASDLVFESIDDGGGEWGDDVDDVEGRDGDEGSGGERRLGGEDVDADDIASLSLSFTFVDIVVFRLPRGCASSRLGCDWTQLGVGASDAVGNKVYCCSDEAVSLGRCHPEEEGRLIVDPAKFEGRNCSLPVPRRGEWKWSAEFSAFDLMGAEEEGRGKVGRWRGAGAAEEYVLLMANCDERNGRDLAVSGDVVWKSSRGYLPGNMFGEMRFSRLLAICYAILLAWYGLRIRREDIVPVHKWVVVTVGVGLSNAFARAGDLWAWNVNGDRSSVLMYAGAIAGVIERALFRCLVVMLSLGWGVTCDGLGYKMIFIAALGVVYAGSSAAREVMLAQAVTTDEVLSIGPTVAKLSVVTTIIDSIFLLWFFYSLIMTINLLKGSDQSWKLKRFLRLRLYLLLSVVFAVLWKVFKVIHLLNRTDTSHEEGDRWVLNAMRELYYIMALFEICRLWSQEAGANDYSHVTELSAIPDPEPIDRPETKSVKHLDAQSGV